MSTLLNLAFAAILLIALVWVAIFGTIGALYMRERGGNALAGFALGAVLGPIGWAIAWFATREPRPSAFEQASGGPDALELDESNPVAPDDFKLDLES